MVLLEAAVRGDWRASHGRRRGREDRRGAAEDGTSKIEPGFPRSLNVKTFNLCRKRLPLVKLIRFTTHCTVITDSYHFPFLKGIHSISPSYTSDLSGIFASE